MNHSHSVPNTSGTNLGLGFYNPRNGAGNPGDSTSYANLRHRHSATFTPSLQSSDTETRPNNFTSIIWKRIT